MAFEGIGDISEKVNATKTVWIHGKTGSKNWPLDHMTGARGFVLGSHIDLEPGFNFIKVYEPRLQYEELTWEESECERKRERERERKRRIGGEGELVEDTIVTIRDKCVM